MQLLTIIRIIGILVMSFSITMLLPAFIALIYGDGGGREFVQSFLLTFSVGAFLWWFCREHKYALRSREGFLIVVLFWVVLGLLGAVPFIILDNPDLSLSESIFESFSGLTTTGATVITDLDSLPKAILFYRQFLQWLGGMGMIVLAVAIIPLFGISSVQLYRAESSNPLRDKSLPRITEVAKILWIIYLGLTLCCAGAYYLLGMNLFDAVSHSFSTVANGGMSTHNDGLVYFNSNKIYLVTALFMLIGGCNFGLHISLIYQYERRYSIVKHYWHNPEFRFFFISQLIFIALFSFGLYLAYNYSFNDAISKGAIQLTSMSMTSGYTIFDINTLPPVLGLLLVFSAIWGGCSGSTSGGLKTIRVLVLWLLLKKELNMLIHPNLQKTIKIGDQVLPISTQERIWAFLIASIFVFLCFVFAAILCGMGIGDAVGAVLATLTNAGPGLGMVSGNFSGVSDSAKYIFSLAMICGRLEIFSLLIIFTPYFWKD
ncbi:potassium transporter TrkG [[Haemophilus] ducreyi]|uniref:potassium transporter TrkG n=1 Tax=Haemophilus ducreyi TaxID=730 RepID=UPI000655CBD0|nr:potassium transporter TrkG [[Haemophilus] ducreyi]AKO46042.1 potassium transporter [[Haemophilus] ducreyi]AKO47400.1 potassium transporter [[Haemophilus] ducreyi]AKO48767.1 potassium transporter [[Haemophilus] ducreyi]AKO50138.1 potassium transporter [[Haemophilus] ducreyi]ANF61979.1 potassium transporter [[Haemophilus] ducreyi]